MAANTNAIILCDTGPLVALLDRADRHHKLCLDLINRLPIQSILTTWPCFSEAMYFAGKIGGHPAQDQLWEFVAKGFLQLNHSSEVDWHRMRDLMRQYADAPMDMADASLVITAEKLNINRLFTLDSHFRIFLIHDQESFEIVE